MMLRGMLNSLRGVGCQFTPHDVTRASIRATALSDVYNPVEGYQSDEILTMGVDEYSCVDLNEVIPVNNDAFSQHSETQAGGNPRGNHLETQAGRGHAEAQGGRRHAETQASWSQAETQAETQGGRSHAEMQGRHSHAETQAGGNPRGNRLESQGAWSHAENQLVRGRTHSQYQSMQGAALMTGVPLLRPMVQSPIPPMSMHYQSQPLMPRSYAGTAINQLSLPIPVKRFHQPSFTPQNSTCMSGLRFVSPVVSTSAMPNVRSSSKVQSSVTKKVRFAESSMNEQRKADSCSCETVKNQRKPTIYSGDKNEDFNDYISQFHVISDWNGWSDKEKSMQLIMSLGGPARETWNNLCLGEIPESSDTLIDILKQRFNPAALIPAHKSEFRSRRKENDETYVSYGYDLHRLCRKAFPKMSENVIDEYAKSHFMEYLEGEMRLYVFMEHPETLHEAIAKATRFESVSSADKMQRNHSNHSSEQSSVMGRNGGKGLPRCWHCGDYGHRRLECHVYKEDVLSGRIRPRGRR